MSNATDENNNTEKLPKPTESIPKTHSDFVAFLYAGHGQYYDENVKKLENSFGTKRENIAYVLLAIACIYMIIGSWAEFICNFIGIAYPAYVSVKAIRTEDTSDDTVWLIYWSVFATFAIIDFFAAGIMSVFPIYWICKALFLMYLYLPQTQGAVLLYYEIVDPLVTFIDSFLEEKKFK